ncbi:MAG: glycosyltransferase family 1 protein [SAR202 cluster bacterium]|nr:glycosyltransferase family 1 protein [SAR202 cluster bacterium]
MQDELLEGYNFKFLRNHAPNGSYLKSLVGLANLGIWKELNDTRPDVVVVMSWMNPTWWLTFFASLRFNIPLLLMTDANVNAERLMSPWKSWIKRLFLGGFLFRIATGYLCAGTANRQLYTYYGVPDEKLVPFAYSWGYSHLLEEGKQLRDQKAELRNKYNIPQDAVVILYCGRFSTEKGSMELLEAYKRVSHSRKALVLVGDGRLRTRMEDFVASKGLESVYFMGFQTRNDMSIFYTLADCLILPSHRETWGMVVNEALCFSLPVVISDQVGSGPDLVIPEENGHYFPARDVSALADRITQIIELSDEDRHIMGEKSYSLIKKWTDRDLATTMVKYLDSLQIVRD